MILLLALFAFAVVGATQISITDELDRLASNNSLAYQNYTIYSQQFPQENRDVILLVSGDLLSEAGLRSLLSLHEKLAGEADVARLDSFLTVPRLKTLAQKALQGQSQALVELRDKLLDQRYPPARSLSEDQRTVLMVLQLATSEATDEENFVALAPEVRKLVNMALTDSGLQVRFAGMPILRHELIAQIRQDQWRFATLALILCSVLALIFWRSGEGVLLSAVAPLVTLLWAVGGAGLFGMHINLLSQLTIVLILAISYSGTVQFLNCVRICGQQTASIDSNLRAALQHFLIPGSVATLTTAAGFMALAATSSDLVREFAVFAACSTLLGLLSICLITPIICQWMGQDRVAKALRVGTVTRTTVALSKGDQPPDLTSLVSKHLFGKLPSTTDQILITAVAILSVLAALSLTRLQTADPVIDNLNPAGNMLQTLQFADEQMGGVLPLQVMLSWPADDESTLSARIRQIRVVQNLLNTETPLRWEALPDTLQLARGFGNNSKLASLPLAISGYFMSEDRRNALISTRVPAAGTLAIPFNNAHSATLSTQYLLNQSREQLPEGVKMTLTGFTALLQQSSSKLPWDLLKALFITAILLAGTVYFAYRSLRITVIILFANLCPLLVASGLLVWTGLTLGFPLLIVISLAFGIAVDDSIHLLSRYQYFRNCGLGAAQATYNALVDLRPVLVITTLIIVAGFSTLLTAVTPSLQTVGFSATVALLVALAADLGFLTALLRQFDK